MSAKLEAFLSSHTVAELVEGKHPVSDALASDTIERVMNRLNEKNYISLPVKGEDGKYVGFVSMIDIMTYVAFRSYDPANPGSTNDFVKETSLKEPISTVMGLTDESAQMWSFEEGETLVKVMDYFSKGVHRAIVNVGGKDIVVTQTDAIKFIAKHLSSLGDIAALTISEACLVTGPDNVVSVPMSATALDGFRKMTVHGVSSVCVLGQDGASMLGTLSASDLRGITTSTVKNVLLPVLQFIQRKKTAEIDVRSPTAAVSKTATLAQTIASILATKTHRVWVCEGSKPTGVVSLTDLCSKFSKFDFKKNPSHS